MTIHVIGLGPGGPDLVTAGTLAVIDSIPRRFVRTERHPAASVVTDATTFDSLYERADSMEAVYRDIVEHLVAAHGARGAAVDRGDPAGDPSDPATAPAAPAVPGVACDPAVDVLYAVPGSPVVAEHTVELLSADDRVDVVVHPALSFVDLTWVRLGVDPVRSGARLIDGHRFETEAAGERGPLLVAQCDNRFVLSDIKLSVDDPDGLTATVLQRLGLPDERVVEVGWDDLDRVVEADHLTSLWIPQLPAPIGAGVARFDELVLRLRGADPWKAAQTHDSLKRFLLEEVYEVFEAIDRYDPATGSGAEELCSELGDLLYQVVFHASLARDAGWFTLGDVAASIHDKLVTRHESLDAATGGMTATTSVDHIVALWETDKRSEHGRGSVLDGIPAAMPALARALKVAKKAPAVEGRRLDALPEIDDAALGASLLELVDRAQQCGLDPEDALRRATDARIDELRSFEA